MNANEVKENSLTSHIVAVKNTKVTREQGRGVEGHVTWGGRRGGAERVEEPVPAGGMTH